MRTILKTILSTGVLAFAGATMASAGVILDEIKAHGKLRCGVYQNVPALATLSDEGKWQGFDVDYCRAIAAAVFGDGDAVEYIPMTFAQGIPAVKTREVDLAGLAITYTLGRDTELGLDFIGPTLYSGQGFMVHISVPARPRFLISMALRSVWSLERSLIVLFQISSKPEA